jgi:hypothetical protein
MGMEIMLASSNIARRASAGERCPSIPPVSIVIPADERDREVPYGWDKPILCGQVAL